ncbi:hypothetical protein BDR26DRAFT_874189 [Obelidium mucronatum]|nr:hypothetical protein BDR26DRAFT_874189 [Obelidium mucronatum]
MDGHLVNLIDSPGHVDFASEVSSASRLCDGCLVLVDAVEGVCTQTHTVLRQALAENVRPILVINKMDRLITQLKMSPHEAYSHMSMILEEVNAIVGTFHMENLIADDARMYEEALQKQKDNSIATDNESLSRAVDDGFLKIMDGLSGLISLQLFMHPSWESRNHLSRKSWWGDWYLDPKTKRAIGPKALKGRLLKPFFVQFILDNLWAVHDSVENDREKLEKIVKVLNLKITPRDLKQKDPKPVLQTVMNQWLPLSATILQATIQVLPSPLEAQKIRIPSLLNSLPPLLDKRGAGRRGHDSCDSNSFHTFKDDSPWWQNVRRGKKMSWKEAYKPVEISAATLAAASALAAQEAKKADEPAEEETLIGFARCYSGTVKYHPSKPDLYHTEVKITKLYMLMGRELQELEEVPAGNVFGIGGLDGHVLKTGTLSSSPNVRSFGGVNNDAPILRVALEPYNPSEMNKLIDGLHLLNQADPCVEVVLQETGEHVIITAGALHLERCLKDLRERFAKIEIQVSEPIVPFRETISTFPALPSQDKGNNNDEGEAEEAAEPVAPLPTGTVVTSSQGGLATLRVRAVPLPKNVLNFLEANSRRLKALTEADQLEAQFEEAKLNGDLVDKELWEGIGSRFVDNFFGPREVGPNLLISATETTTGNAWKDSSTSNSEDSSDNQNKPLRMPTAKDYEGSITIGFQLAMLTGPLCNEPMMGVAIFLESFELNLDGADNRQIGLLPGQIMASMRESCRQAFLKWSPRLALAMYSCDLQAPSEVLGKVYAVLNKRRGRILSEEIKDGTPFFQIKSLLPVIESFGFSDDIRKRTAGSASPQLIFSGFEVLDLDPFWVPTTQEELEDLGEKADRENVAKKYMEAVRKRKGLFVEKKIVEFAEKQRTMKQK